MPRVSSGSRDLSRAVYPGTFDPFTPGHLDVVDRACRLFDEVIVLVAINGGKRPIQPITARARQIRAALATARQNVTVATWSGLTAEYCRRYACAVIIRGIRDSVDCFAESELALMNEALGVTTLLMPTRAELAAMSSTAMRMLQG